MIGQDRWDSVKLPTTSNEARLGLCSDCINANVVTTEYGTVYAYCDRFEMSISGRDAIVSCTRYSKRGELTLQEMQDIAIIIEVDKKQAGFIMEK